MKVRLFIVLFLVLSLTAAGQFDGVYRDARAAAMGGCLTRQEDSTGFIEIGWRQGFMLDGMAARSLAVGAPVGKSGSAAAYYNGFGDEDYNEHQVAAGYGIAVAPLLRVVVYGLYSRVGTADGHYAAQQWLDAGGGIVLEKGRTWGYLVAGSRTWSDERPWMLHGGISFRHTEQILSVMGVSLEERLRVRCGMEYAHERQVFVRAGLCTNPMVLTFGVGYRQRHYHIDISTEVHSSLGLSPQISLGICL